MSTRNSTVTADIRGPARLVGVLIRGSASQPPGSRSDRNIPSRRVLWCGSLIGWFLRSIRCSGLAWRLVSSSTMPRSRPAAIASKAAAGWLRRGGVRPRRGRNLKGRCLTLAQREEIALGRARGESIRAIAASIGRSPSTVSRELRRNADGLGRYRATSAHALAYHRASRLGLPDGPCCCLCLVSPAALARGSSPTRARSRPPAPSQARHR